MAATKKQAQEEGIPVWEAECHLDSELFLNEYSRWRADVPQCPCILQRMFAYAEEAGCKECKQTIYQGCQQLTLGRKLRQKLQPSRWWDSGPPRGRSEGSIMRCTKKRDYQAPHMGQSVWRPLIRKSALPWKSRCGRGGVPPGQKKIGGSHCEYFVAQLPDQIPLPDPGKE